MEVNPVTHHVPLTTPRDYTRAIIREVAAQYGASVQEVLGPSRMAHIIRARHAAIAAVMAARPHLTALQISRLFDVDHTTVAYAIGKRRKQQMAAE